MTSQFAAFNFMLFLWKMNSFMWIYAFKREKIQGNVHFNNHSDIYEDQQQVGSWVQKGEFIHTQPAAERHG